MSNELSLPSTKNSDLAFLEIAEAAGGLMLPTVKVVAIGDKAMFSPDAGNDPKDLDLLPSSGKAVPALYIARRIGALSWKVGFDEKEEGDSPAFCAFADPTNDADIKLISAATKAVQMTPRDQKSKYDFEKSKCGHVKPLLELLVFLPGVGFAVVSVAPNFYNVVDGVKALGTLDGPIPVMLKPDATPHKTGKSSAFCSLEVISGDAKGKLAEAFAAYQEANKENLQIRQATDSWLSCTDRPMTDEIRAALNVAVTLNPPRY